MKCNLLLLIFLFLISPILKSQNIQKAFDFLDENKIEKAEKIFIKAVKKNKDIVPAKYGLTIILMKEKNSSVKNIRVYLNLKDIKKGYNKLASSIRQNYEQNYGISNYTIDTLFDWVIEKEYQKTLKSEKISIYNYFAEIFQNTPEAYKVLRIRDSVIYSDVQNDGDLFAYRKFINDYPDSPFLKNAKNNRDSIWKQQYNSAYRSLEYASIKSFMAFNSDYPFFDDSTNIYATWAILAAKLQLHLGYLGANNDYYCQFIKLAAPFEMAYQTLLCLIQPDIENENINAAIDTVNKYSSYFNNSQKIQKLTNILETPKTKIVPKSLSENINSNAFEYMPVISADGKTLYFCSEERDRSIGYEDVFMSVFKNGKWSKPVCIVELSSSRGNEAPLSVSADGNSLIIFANGDIFISSKTKNGWNAKRPIKKINTKKFWEADAFITADGNAIIFSSDREGNIGAYHEFNKPFHGDYIGNLDLYVITKNQDGSWSQPINLGKNINTPYSERTPFLHPDMKTLYFSSDGHPGVGKMDVFKVTRLSDSLWNEWSEPENLGLSINTPQKEYGYKISTDGTKAYYTKFFKGQSDIYYTSLPKQNRPEQVATISGFITDKDGNPLDAKIVWENLFNSKKLGQLSSNPTTGKYFITLPLKKNYGIFVSKVGYYPVSDNINLLNLTTQISIEKNFQLVNINNIIDGSESINLKNVFFDYDKFILKKESFPELNRLADFLFTYSGVKIEISGHTDSKGVQDYNQKLSQQRAEAVKDYLISKGCNEQQLRTKGYGASKPIANNDTEKGRKMNRRVEFKVVR